MEKRKMTYGAFMDTSVPALVWHISEYKDS